MKKKGAEIVTIFLLSVVIFCSSSVSVFAEVNEWGYNDSYVNSVSSENKQLYFLPMAPASEYSDYMVVYWQNDYYLILGNGNFLIFGSGYIQRPGTTSLYIYSHSSNNWEPATYPDSFFGSIPGFGAGLTVIDATSLVEFWGAGTPIQDLRFTNYTGYRLYWNLALMLIQILTWVNNIADYIMSFVLIRYLCLASLGGEFLIFCVLILRRVGDLHEKNIS